MIMVPARHLHKVNRTSHVVPFALAAICFFLFSGYVFSQGTGNRILHLSASGETGKLESLLSSGQLAEDESRIVKSILEKDGMKAIQEFESLFTEKEYDPALKAIAGAHLFGYYRLIDNQEKSNSVLRFLEKEREMAVLLFPGHNLPSASTFQTDKAAEYMIQIGAFKNRERALKVAGKTVIPGKECKVIPVVRAKRTLYVVRVGYFTSAGEAESFGKSQFGTRGKDFTIVTRDQR